MGHLAGPLPFPLGGDPDSSIEKPIAVILPAEQRSVVGAIVKFDGRSSISPRDTELSYSWEFVQIPIGSQVAHFGFTDLEDDRSIVSFAPDLTGSYQVRLTVYDGTTFSDPVIGVVDCRIIIVPHHEGFTPDASFIWNYLSDFWAKVDGRNKFETFWSAAIQLVASEQLKLYQYDYNKSIRDIQDVIQKRWISYSPSLAIDRTKVSFILADDQAGSGAITTVLDSSTSVPTSPQPSYTSHIAVPVEEGSFQTTAYGQKISIGRVIRLGEMSFTFARPSVLSPSLDYGLFGITTVSTGNFSGGGFSAGMVGDTLRILSGTLAGDYLIDGFIDSSHITVDTTWLSSLTGVSYTVLSATPTYNSCFADQALIPAGLSNKPWRFSSTLISQEFDFEYEGVTIGDLLEVEIARQDVTLVTTIYAQVVSVDRDRLGFVLNLDDLLDGQQADWFSQSAQIQMAADLQVRGLSMGISGDLVYTTDSLAINQLISSVTFRRQYFETELTPSNPIDVGLFSITARPVQIIRQSKIRIDSSVVSIPVLQEYIRQPDVITNTDGGIQLVVEGGVISASRAPYLMVENLDYILDSENQVTGVCNVTNASNEIQVPFGDLIDRSISERDFIDVEAGGVVTQYEIRQVLAPDLLQVYPVPSVSLLLAPFVIKRRVTGKYIRFVDGTFTKTRAAPVRFWAEVTYFDNNDAVEANFGVLVGLTREQLSQTNATAPYRSAVAGLMYALANGPTINNLTLSAQILLGLPFTQNAGVITSIVPDYRKREDGSPLYGQILVEARDGDNNPTGVTNIYIYSQGTQIFDSISGKWIPAIPDFSGLAINQETGKEFAVGDTVDQFVVLSKGVEIQEYLATPDWTTDLLAQGNFASLIQRYHAFQLIMNADLVSAADINLASEFIQRAKPHYLKLTSSLLKALQDTVDTEDFFTLSRGLNLFETPGLSLPSTLMFDNVDEDEALLQYDGTYYVRYLSSDDLETTKDSLQVTSVTGGFTTAVSPHSYDTPLLRPGDLLIIFDSSNSGNYVVSSVDSDTSCTVEAGTNFETLANQVFSVYRPIRNPIWDGLVSITNGNALVSAHEHGGDPAALKSSGPAVGDRLVFRTGTSISNRIYNVIEVNPDPLTPTIRITPTPTETTAQYAAWIVREPLLTKNLVAPYGVSSPVTLRVDITNGSNAMVWNTGMSDDSQWLNACLVRPGDTLILSGIPYTVIANDPSNGQVWVSPPASSTASNQSCYISRPSAPDTPISYNILDHVPDDFLQLDLSLSSSVATDRLVTTASSTDVSTALSLDFSDLGVISGDCVLIQEGADSTRDIGYGAGVYPILKLVSSTQLRLIAALTATHGSPGILYGIRKLRPQ